MLQTRLEKFNQQLKENLYLDYLQVVHHFQMYKRLIEFNKVGIISSKNVVTFNMDEYLGLEATLMIKAIIIICITISLTILI